MEKKHEISIYTCGPPGNVLCLINNVLIFVFSSRRFTYAGRKVFYLARATGV